jgi:NADH-quinone oxidoreductase subunit M
MFQRVFFGPITNPENANLKDLSRREVAYLAPLVILCFVIGLWPGPFFKVIEKPVEYLVAKVDPTLAAAQAASIPASTLPSTTGAAGQAGE